MLSVMCMLCIEGTLSTLGWVLGILMVKRQMCRFGSIKFKSFSFG